MPIYSLNRRSGFQSYLCCQVREIISIYGPTISSNENNEPIQGWNPSPTIKIKTLKMRFNDSQKYNESNNK